ncbi:signal peptide and Sec14d domain-containing protein [Cryptosporidium canis]|uniref:Signal peptide and Sec14d domain-containing protein n=1 Tax=Cryptosporidium canis TaxID=195482 RepID=A0A9D5DF62_9CRYT|nr:signal peptide and Sec14d domain-containing protein [Cryptosporidium canis]
MSTEYTIFHVFVGIWLLILTRLEPANGKTDPRFKFGPLHLPHDRTIINDFDAYAIHYCGLKDSLFQVSHCVFHALVEVLDEREVRYDDYESAVSLLFQGKNLESHQKILSSVSACESMVIPYVQISKPKSSKSIMGLKFSTKFEDFCKFAYRCFHNGPHTLIKSKESVFQKYLARWISTGQRSEGLGLVLASRLDLQTSKLKIRSKEPNELSQIANRLALQPPAKREALCNEILNHKELCSIVAPYRLEFDGWLRPPVDPVRNLPFRFDPKTMIDEKVKGIVTIQVNEELPPYCIPQEIFSFQPSPEAFLSGKRKIHLYTDLSPQEKTIINHFLMSFVINHGKIPRVIFDNRSRFAIEGWLSHKNKFPIISVHNSMYSLGRKLQYKDAMSGMLYSNSGSKKEVYPYNLPQFKIFSVYSDKVRNFEISDTNPLISVCLKEGCAYYIGRSATLSPVLVIRASTIISIKNFKQSSASFLSMFLMAFAEKYLFYPGKVETIDVVVDCRGFSLSNFPTLLRIRPIITYWQDEGIINQFPLRFNRIFIIQQSDIWSTLKDILGKFWLDETIKSVQVINVPSNSKDSPDLKFLWRYMSPYIIEMDMGGVRPKIQSGDFYPFKILPGPYRPFNPNLLDSQAAPALSDWPKPDLESPKNLYGLLPKGISSPRGKTLDGNDEVVPIDWKESKRLLDAIPKNLWPDMSAQASGSKAGEGSESVSGSKAPHPVREEDSREASIEPQDKTQPEAPQTAKDTVKSEQVTPPTHTIPKGGKGKDLLAQLFVTQRVLSNLRQLQLLRLERSRNKRSLAEQCIRFTKSHISFFSSLISRALVQTSRYATNTQVKKLSKDSQSIISKRVSIVEAYSDIISNLKLDRAWGLLSQKRLDSLDQTEKQLSALETKLNESRQEIKALLSESPEELKERAPSVWNSLMSVLHELDQLKKKISEMELKEKLSTQRLQKACEQLTSSLSVAKSFLDSYSKYDHWSMFESSLLLNMIDTILDDRKRSYGQPAANL